jgi:hypothetical protein
MLRYIEDCDLSQWKLPDIKFFIAGIKDLHSKLNYVVNPHLFDQVYFFFSLLSGGDV